MARRRIKTIKVGSRCEVVIYRDVEWNEYNVRQIIGGRVTGGKDGGGGFADTKGEARSMAAHMVWRLKKMPACRAQ